MRISRIQISNFRNFNAVDIKLGENAVIVGENKIGKSNILYALRLILDPSLPDSDRKLRDEDFWDGLTRPLGEEDLIRISVDLADFEDNENQLAVLAEHLIEPEPMISRLTYEWRPLPGLEGDPKKDSDYEFVIYGGDRTENFVSYQVRQRLPMDLFPAMRDCEGDLMRWTRSPLRPLLDQVAGEVEAETLEKLADKVNVSTAELTEIKEVKAVADAIEKKLVDMMGKGQSLQTALRFTPTEADKLIRALRVYIDNGKRGINDASLGSANLLYFALKALEYEQMVADGDRDHTFWAIEEPEAHLHPILQRLIFRNYLRPRGFGQRKTIKTSSTVLMTTHSPHIASVTPLNDIVLLKQNKNGSATEAVSTAGISLDTNDLADLERYLDVNRGEVLFAKGVILVEGDAERFLLPVLAKNNGYDLDELGIAVCSISGTNFYPYLTLLGPNGLDLPFTALTDFDPRKPKDGKDRDPLGPNRVVNEMVRALIETSTWDDNEFEDLLNMAPELGVFMNSHTFEIDLFITGLSSQFLEAMETTSSNGKAKERIKELAKTPDLLQQPFEESTQRFLKDIDDVGKGRFAQRLASILEVAGEKNCPEYILKGVKYVAEKSQLA
ncbi:AAA family ATPase [uncultured Gimesia sp.]|uniref:ATP-dependent nuclease n=1 Tax=uncultured Gimesia sp. TaxID=1678688 RepID=UPI00261C79FA|nr:AAA family ATPase [uncultured Gimesia sp.]